MSSQGSEFRINDQKVEWISPILKQWLSINKEYIEQYEFGDCLHWYNERANISALAGAVWKSGGFALEEYSTKKGAEDNRANGRVDLYFSNDNDQAIAEAKMEWLYFGKRTKLALQEKFDRVTAKAKADIINSLHANPYELGLGISFIATYWKENYNAAADMKNLREFMKSYGCAFYAIFENTSGNNLISSKGNVCNAVILVGTAHS